MFHIRGGPSPVEDFRTGGHRMDAGMSPMRGREPSLMPEHMAMIIIDETRH